MMALEPFADVEDALLLLLTNGARISPLVGLNVFPDELPQKPTYPAIVYQVISAPRGYTMDCQDGATPFRIQVDCYAESAFDARRMREAVRRDLGGYQGEVATSPAVYIHGIFLDNEGDSAEAALERSGSKVKRKRLDLIVWTKEG